MIHHKEVNGYGLSALPNWYRIRDDGTNLQLQLLRSTAAGLGKGVLLRVNGRTHRHHLGRDRPVAGRSAPQRWRRGGNAG